VKIEELTLRQRNAVESLGHIEKLLKDILKSNPTRISKDQRVRLEWAHTLFNVINDVIKEPK